MKQLMGHYLQWRAAILLTKRERINSRTVKKENASCDTVKINNRNKGEEDDDDNEVEEEEE